MTLVADDLIRRFLIHVLPKGLHCICRYGLFAKPVALREEAFTSDL
jgi:hypothetical protein